MQRLSTATYDSPISSFFQKCIVYTCDIEPRLCNFYQEIFFKKKIYHDEVNEHIFDMSKCGLLGGIQRVANLVLLKPKTESYLLPISAD